MQESNTKKVRCKNCKNFDTITTRCAVKKDKVSDNKRRFCANYHLDITKVVIRPKLASRYAPIWEVDGTVRRKMLKAFQKEREATAVEVTTPTSTYLVEEPALAPDCLANIRSTAVDLDEVIS